MPSNPSAHINRDDSERWCFSPASSAAWIRYKELESGFHIAPVSAMKKETRGLRLRKRVAGEGDRGILADQQSGPERDGQDCDQRTCMSAPNYTVRVFPHTTKQFSDTGWLSPNPVLTLSAQRRHQIPQVRGSVLQGCPSPTFTHPLQVPAVICARDLVAIDRRSPRPPPWAQLIGQRGSQD